MSSGFVLHRLYINRYAYDSQKKNKIDVKTTKFKPLVTTLKDQNGESSKLDNSDVDTSSSETNSSENEENNSQPSDDDSSQHRSFKGHKEEMEEDECIYTYCFKEKSWKQNGSKIMKYGYPGTENVFFKKGFVLSYSFKHKQPLWVMEMLHKRSFHDNDFNLGRNSCSFLIDPDIPSIFSSSNEDYRNSGYDRGHMAAFANHKHDPNDMCKTFFLSNVSPQIGHGFNRNIWEQLESHARYLRNKKYQNVYACTGILFLPSYNNDGNKFEVNYPVIGKNNVSVPTHFFKIILGVTKNKEFELESFIIPNQQISDKIQIKEFRVSLEQVEKASGLIFFNKINREEIIEVLNEVTVPRHRTSS